MEWIGRRESYERVQFWLSAIITIDFRGLHQLPPKKLSNNSSNLLYVCLRSRNKLTSAIRNRHLFSYVINMIKQTIHPQGRQDLHKPIGIEIIAIALRTSLSDMTILGEAKQERQRWISNHSATNDLGLAHFVAETMEAELGRFFYILKHLPHRDQRDLLCGLIESKLDSNDNDSAFMTLVQVNQILRDSSQILDSNINRNCPQNIGEKVRDTYLIAQQAGEPVDQLESIGQMIKTLDSSLKSVV